MSVQISFLLAIGGILLGIGFAVIVAAAHRWVQKGRPMQAILLLMTLEVVYFIRPLQMVFLHNLGMVFASGIVAGLILGRREGIRQKTSQSG